MRKDKTAIRLTHSRDKLLSRLGWSDTMDDIKEAYDDYVEAQVGELARFCYEISNGRLRIRKVKGVMHCMLLDERLEVPIEYFKFDDIVNMYQQRIYARMLIKNIPEWIDVITLRNYPTVWTCYLDIQRDKGAIHSSVYKSEIK